MLQPEFEDSLELLCSFVKRQLKRATTEKFELDREASHPPLPIPYLFATPKVLSNASIIEYLPDSLFHYALTIRCD